jgi:hypothetical protein
MSFADDFVILSEAKELNCRLENNEKSYELKLIENGELKIGLTFGVSLYEIRCTKYELR